MRRSIRKMLELSESALDVAAPEKASHLRSIDDFPQNPSTPRRPAH